MLAMAGAARVHDDGGELDPRVERSRRVILEAVLEELGEVGYGAFTIEGVAARAGVGKSTIYRHWDGKLELVEDAFHTLKAQAHVPEGGSFRDRVVGLPRAGRRAGRRVDVLDLHARPDRRRRA